jgi:hypothetical protein
MVTHDPGTTIESLERESWPDPAEDASTLVRRVHTLRRTPTAELTPEDLRVLVGQRVGLDAVLPIALERLAEDPLVAGDYYPGDLIAALVGLGPEFWDTRPAWRTRLVTAIGAIDRSRPEFPSPTGLGERLDEFLSAVA